MKPPGSLPHPCGRRKESGEDISDVNLIRKGKEKATSILETSKKQSKNLEPSSVLSTLLKDNPFLVYEWGVNEIYWIISSGIK